MLVDRKGIKIGLLIPRAIESPAVVRLYNSIAYFATNIGIDTIGEPSDLKPLGSLTFRKVLDQKRHLYYRLVKAVLNFDALLILYPFSVFVLEKDCLDFLS